MPKWKIEAARTAVACPSLDAGHEIVEVADAARGDDRHTNRIGDRARQLEIVADFRSVAIHRGDEQFAGPALDHFRGEIHGVDAGRIAAAMGVDLPGAEIVLADRLRKPALGVDRDDDALVAELVRRFRNEIRIVDRRRIDRNLVGAAEQQLADVGDACARRRRR